MYYIGTGSNYIGTKPDNTMFITDKLSEARRYSTPQRASHALVTLPRKFYEFSCKWSVREDINEITQPQQPEIVMSEPKKETKVEAPKTEAIKVEEIKAEALTEEDINFAQIFEDVASLKQHKKGCLSKLNGELSRISEEITDLEHYIEFSKFNVPDAYKAYKMLRDTLQERRKLKDTIRIVTELYDNCNVDKIASVKKELDNRVYKPRQLKGLFDEATA